MKFSMHVCIHQEGERKEEQRWKKVLDKPLYCFFLGRDDAQQNKGCMNECKPVGWVANRKETKKRENNAQKTEGDLTVYMYI